MMLDQPAEHLADFLSKRSSTPVTVEQIEQRFYFYVLPKAGSNDMYLAIDAGHPKGEKWLFDGESWRHAERLKF